MKRQNINEAITESIRHIEGKVRTHRGKTNEFFAMK